MTTVLEFFISEVKNLTEARQEAKEIIKDVMDDGKPIVWTNVRIEMEPQRLGTNGIPQMWRANVTYTYTRIS